MLADRSGNAGQQNKYNHKTRIKPLQKTKKNVPTSFESQKYLST
jgi:hypothetical protein